MRSGKPFASSRRKSTNPFVVFSKLSPNASRLVGLIVTLGSSRMLAGLLPSEKKKPAGCFEQLVDLDAGCRFLLGHSGPLFDDDGHAA